MLLLSVEYFLEEKGFIVFLPAGSLPAKKKIFLKKFIIPLTGRELKENIQFFHEQFKEMFKSAVCAFCRERGIQNSTENPFFYFLQQRLKREVTRDYLFPRFIILVFKYKFFLFASNIG